MSGGFFIEFHLEMKIQTDSDHSASVPLLLILVK